METLIPPSSTSTKAEKRPGQSAREIKGFWRAERFLILRRCSQIGVLLLFLVGPWFGVWIIKGNLASSLFLDTVPLSDPYLLLQSALTGMWPLTPALIGGAIVLAFYALLGGRVYCAWVCPINPVTDLAAWLRRRFHIKTGQNVQKNTRYYLLAFTLLGAILTGSLVWEWINPVSLVQRSLIFGLGGGVSVLLIIFFYDLFLAQRGWCGHLCPVGAFYSLLGHKALLRVSAHSREHCDDCMDCFHLCPEPQVIRLALKGTGSPLILSSQCTNCARCVDACPTDVFHLTHRFDHSRSEP